MCVAGYIPAKCSPRWNFQLLDFLEASVHGHPGPCDFSLEMSQEVAGFVPLIDSEFARGGIAFGIEGQPLLDAGGADESDAVRVIRDSEVVHPVGSRSGFDPLA